MSFEQDLQGLIENVRADMKRECERQLFVCDELLDIAAGMAVVAGQSVANASQRLQHVIGQVGAPPYAQPGMHGYGYPPPGGEMREELPQFVQNNRGPGGPPPLPHQMPLPPGYNGPARG
jgi:hypothetical protein